jgi:hypothetical protein
MKFFAYKDEKELLKGQEVMIELGTRIIHYLNEDK